jgi:hypothetical protein
MRITQVMGRVLAVLALAGVAAWAPAQTPDAAADARTVAEYQKRLQEYVSVHKKIEGGLAALPNKATPEQIDALQRQLSQGISTARAAAKPGDIFHPAMQEWVRRTLVRVFSGPDGKQLRSSILDENPVGAAVRVNGPYPDAIPLSTMPPKVLEALPKLPEELEYRFVGDRLILFDHHAHIIADYVDRALPKV